MSVTHGWRQKKFIWRLVEKDIAIENENGREHVYSLTETYDVIMALKNKFREDWFPLANNVELMGLGEEKDGLGVAILNVTPKDITHAQGSSYLGVVLEEIGVFEWNGEKKGIHWRIVKIPSSIEDFIFMIKNL